jgi:hypothetical protein
MAIQSRAFACTLVLVMLATAISCDAASAGTSPAFDLSKPPHVYGIA